MMKRFFFLAFQISFLITIPSSIVQGASSAPGRSNLEHAQTQTVPFEKEEERDAAKHFYAADVVAVGILDRIILNRAGVGQLPVKIVQVAFKDLKVLKGPALDQEVFLYKKSADKLRYPRHSKVLVTLKKDSQSGFIIDEIFQATQENRSLVPSP